MPAYLTRCANPACELNGEPQEFFCRAPERDGLRCACGHPLDTHPDQFAGVAVQRDWDQSRRDNFGMSRDITFGAKPDFASIAADCPSMELKPDKFGWFRPVSRNDAHDRRWKKQMEAASDRHHAAQTLGGTTKPTQQKPTGVGPCQQQRP